MLTLQQAVGGKAMLRALADLPWSWIVPLIDCTSWLPSVPWGFVCEVAPYLESPPVRTQKGEHQPTSDQKKEKQRFWSELPTWEHILKFQKCLIVPFITILTEGERDNGGVSWRASSGWFPDQSCRGDVLRGSELLSTPPPLPHSSCFTLTPTSTMLTSPLEWRCSAGGLGSTILLKDKCTTDITCTSHGCG